MKRTKLVINLLFLLAATATVAAAQKKPNILVIWGDDVGMWNIS
jgi:hypothetical protein